MSTVAHSGPVPVDDALRVQVPNGHLLIVIGNDISPSTQLSTGLVHGFYATYMNLYSYSNLTHKYWRASKCSYVYLNWGFT